VNTRILIHSQPVTATATLRSVTKAMLAEVLSRLPTLRLQQIAGRIVRRVWPGFPAA